MLPVLGALQDRYRDQPVVVAGVHSNKFPAEASAERIRAAMRRYGVAHPVLVDAGREVWESYTVKAWPTLVVLAPDGTIATALAGETRLESLEAIVDRELELARDAGELGEPFEPSAESAPPDEVLAYPAKVLATPQGLAIADTGHHRIVLLDASTKRLSAIGSGTPGLSNGTSEQARFSRPQGLALLGSTLFVADTGNHALRSVDLETLDVDTVAGNGRLAQSVPDELAEARKVELRSPWDLAVSGGILFVAMAVSWWFLWDGELTRLEGVLLFMGLIAMVVWLGIQGAKEASAGTEDAAIQFGDDDIPNALPTSRAVGLFVVGLLFLLIGSRVLVWGSVDLATSLGVSELVIGLTLVALGTSLPELAASVAASRRGEQDIAVGNVVGSNIFNILGVLALPGIIAPGPVSHAVVVRDYPIMLGATLLLLFMAVNKRNIIGHKRGAALVVIFILYFVLLFVQPSFIQAAP